MNEGYSIADIAAVTGNGRSNGDDGAWGGNGAWWLIVLFIFAFCGWGNGGWGGAGNGGSSAVQGALTRGDLCMDMNFQEVKREVQNANDAVNLGFANLNSTICNQQYDTAQMINSLGTTIQGGFNAANVVALQGQNAIERQISDCCCKFEAGQAQTRYDMATNTCNVLNTMNNNTRDIIQSQEAGTRAILDYLCQDKISTLTAENQGLRLAASQAAQNNYLISQLRPSPVPSYQVPNPYATYGYGCGCSCNTGCGCGGFAA